MCALKCVRPGGERTERNARIIRHCDDVYFFFFILPKSIHRYYYYFLLLFSLPVVYSLQSSDVLSQDYGKKKKKKPPVCDKTIAWWRCLPCTCTVHTTGDFEREPPRRRPVSPKITITRIFLNVHVFLIDEIEITRIAGNCKIPESISN